MCSKYQDQLDAKEPRKESEQDWPWRSEASCQSREQEVRFRTREADTIVNVAENLMKMQSTSGHRINVELVRGGRDSDIRAVVGTEGKWLVK